MPRTPRVSRPTVSKQVELTEDDLRVVAYLEATAMENNSNGYLYRAEMAREWYLEDGKIDRTQVFGELWKDQDYAWRVLLRKELHDAIIQQLEGGDNDPLTDAHKAKVVAILTRLSDHQPVDVVMYCKLDDQYELILEIAEALYQYLVEGEIPELEEDLV